MKLQNDPEGLKAAKERLKQRREEYSKYSKDHELREHNDRASVARIRKGNDVFGKIYKNPIGGAPITENNSEKLLDNGAESGIIKENKLFGFKAISTEHSISNDIGNSEKPTCNPNYNSGDINYRLNCGYCIAAYEMRRRGYDVEANPKEYLYVSEWLNLFKNTQQVKINAKTPTTAVKEIKYKISQWGNNSRGSIFVNWTGKKIGHFFSFEVKDGEIMFVDAQTGNLNVESYFQMVDLSSVTIVRLDNLEPSEIIKEACKNKE